jgi:hypothetical protein
MKAGRVDRKAGERHRLTEREMKSCKKMEGDGVNKEWKEG